MIIIVAPLFFKHLLYICFILIYICCVFPADTWHHRIEKGIGCCYFVPGIAFVFSFCLISNINCQLDRKYISTSFQWMTKGLFPLHRRVIQILAYKQAVKEVQCSITQPLSWRTLVNRTTRDTVGLFGSRQAKTILCQPGINNIVLIVLSKLIWQLGEAVIYLMTEFLWRQSILLQLEMCVRVWFLVVVVGRGGAKHLPALAEHSEAHSGSGHRGPLWPCATLLLEVLL